MKLYRIQRKSDGMFLGEGKKSPDKHGPTGRFYTTPYTALGAITNGHILTNYRIIEYIVRENFSEDLEVYANSIL